MIHLVTDFELKTLAACRGIINDRLFLHDRPCSDIEFSCGDGSCISAAMHCNKIPDCPDNSDEENCGKQPIG